MTPNKQTPLVVDLDGTLTPTDTLHESLVELLKTSLSSAFLLPGKLMVGRATLKDYVASHIHLDATQLPYRASLVSYLKQQHTEGRRIILATAAHESIAKAVAKHFGFFEHVIASNASTNMKGKAKLIAIQEFVGERFVYAGDSKADLPIWAAAEAAILIATPDSVANAVRAKKPVEYELPRERHGVAVWAKALRIHQWIKNLLLFVPLLTSFGFVGLTRAMETCLAFAAFSFAASATYLLNDLLDIRSDRLHPRKRKRPFASAQLPIPYGILATAMLMTAAFVIAATLPQLFLLSLATYVFVTTAYSWVLKHYVLVDVLTLSLLYTLRIFAGCLAISVPVSPWLMAFSVFLFLSLAIVKRCAELVSIAETGLTATLGRDYRTTDLTVLWPLGVGSSLCSAVVFGLYINSSETQVRYASPQLLWLVGVGLIYWVARLWIKTARGEMHDDPIVFAVRDFGSRVTILCMVVVSIAAYFIHIIQP